MKKNNWPPTLKDVVMEEKLHAKLKQPEDLLVEKIIKAMHGEKFLDKAPGAALKTSRKAAMRVIEVIADYLKSEGTWLDTVPATDDPFSKWTQDPEIQAKYRGKRIAVHRDKGIVASGDSLVEVYNEVIRQGYLGEHNDNDPIAFDSIPEI